LEALEELEGKFASHIRFLGNSFWSSFRGFSSQSVEELLNKQDTTVEMLLEDDDVI
jgi:hypothetical protein